MRVDAVPHRDGRAGESQFRINLPGHHLAKGDELGYFQFGRSTHCLVFEPGLVD